MSNNLKRAFGDVEDSTHGKDVGNKRPRTGGLGSNVVSQPQLQPAAGLGTNDHPKGEVTHDVHNSLLWKKSPQEWIQAVYHNDIRDKLQSMASSDGQFRYKYPRASGLGAHDVTAYHPEQQFWSGERKLWPQIENNILNRLEEKGYIYEHGAEVPDDWYFTDGADKYVPFSLSRRT